MIVSLSTQGYSNTTIKGLAHDARVSLRTFYQHFDSKEACFLAAYRQVTSQLLEREPIPSSEGASLRSDIERNFDRSLRELTRLPRLTYAFVIDSATLGHAARVERQRVQRGLAEQLVRHVDLRREAHPNVRACTLPEPVARLVVSGLGEMVVDLIIRDELDRLPELVRAATDVVWSTISSVEGQAPATP